ncbi:hypothetical protein PUN28_004885 [Cardiocondyla obscurior]|uniref:Uncharacterized protein n=1 Tax=Cardiocondyla obscurior TaxID=286306 RepID=A0AAW2GHM4_9HYME
MVMREGHGLAHEKKTCTDTWDKRSRRWCLRPRDRVSTVRIKRNPSPPLQFAHEATNFDCVTADRRNGKNEPLLENRRFERLLHIPKFSP